MQANVCQLPTDIYQVAVTGRGVLRWLQARRGVQISLNKAITWGIGKGGKDYKGVSITSLYYSRLIEKG